LNVYLLVVLLDRIQIRSIQKAKTNAGFLVVKQVHVCNSKFVWRRFAKLSEVIFRERDLVDIEEYRQREIQLFTR